MATASWRLRCQNKADAFLKLFYNPNQPNLDDYYEPFTYKYEDLFTAKPGDDQPTAIPVSLITGEPMEIKAGPNWDDDLSGSPIYAENDLNLDSSTEEERAQLFEVERLTMFYLPRICNHCANPTCVAACPSGAIYKRGEDGIVLINQEKCRGWRACVAACPVQEDLLQLEDRKVGEVHPVLPAPRNRPGAGLLPFVRRPHPLPGRDALRCRPRARTR